MAALIPDGLTQAHKCLNCGADTLSLPSVLRSTVNGRLPSALNGTIPSNENVARWLRPPDVPAEAAPARRDIWGPSFQAAVVVVVALLTGLMLCAILGWILGPIITVAATIPVYIFVRRQATHGPKKVSNDHERTLALRAWDRRMEVWERIGVCPKCGHLSDATTGRVAEWHSVPSLYS